MRGPRANRRSSGSMDSHLMAIVDVAFSLLILFLLLWLSKSIISIADKNIDAKLVENSQEMFEQRLRDVLAERFSLGDVYVEVEGNLQRVRFGDDALFPKNDTALGESGAELLRILASLLQFDNQQGDARVSEIVVQCYTDSDAWFTNPEDDGNWDLSVGRAIEVVKWLEKSGVDPSLMSATGYSWYHNSLPDDSEENKSKNRRLELKLEYSVGRGGRVSQDSSG